MKNKIYNLILVGSGLSSLMFADSFLKKNNKIDIISFKKNKTKYNQVDNKHILKILPPQMIGEEKQVQDYFSLNNILVDQNTKIFGSLEFGGLSNYWGLQIDKNILEDISHLSKITQKKIIKSFEEIFTKQKLIGSVNNSLKNQFSEDEYIDEEFKKEKNNLFSDQPILAFCKKKLKRKINLNEINEKKDKLTPKNFFKKNLKDKKITFHNYFVENILDHKKGILLNCSNGSNKKAFITKKLVLGSGTLITTKLLMEYLKLKKTIKIKHHPRLFSVYVSKKRWKNNMSFQPSHFHLKSKKNPSLFTADFRPGNKVIVDAIIKFKKILIPFKFILNFIREYLIFSNIFLSPKYSNLYIKKENNLFRIFSKKNNEKNLFKNIGNLIYTYLKNSNKILPLYLNYFPGYGADFHYFGTVPINEPGKMSVDESCRLKSNKKITIIDGSIFNFKKNKYPLGIIMANSKRIGKEF